MKIFDCDVAYGRGAVALPREVETVSALLAELDHHGIDDALVWHRDSFERDFEVGNRRLGELEAHPRLHRTRTLAPTCCSEMLHAEALIRRMRAEKVRAVRLFPAQHRFRLDRVSCGDLLELLIACSVPVFVPLAQFPNAWHGVYELMRDFPRLTLVVTESGCWGEDRYFRPLMKTYRRFFVTSSRFETAGQLKDLVDTLGHKGLLFGSALPFNCPGGYVMMIMRARISDEAKEAILYGSLERLLEEVAW